MKIELLAPAGSFQSLKAAIHAGADAVYLGGDKFGARAYADNFDRKQMIEAIHYTHIHGKKLYLTVNTLLKNREIERDLYEYLAPYYENGMDAVIVQDLGVMEFIRYYFPDIPIHASTQMTITGVESAKILKEAGASRIVTARELSLKEIREIYDATHMEIESFIHGALCYCYSGQCLMSSLIGGRSGNRGRCAQPCRLPYEAYRQGKKLNNERTNYPLSPKDMCTIHILPQIIDAGVHSLKIEGRMKKPEYTAGVVSIYRKYLDQYIDRKNSFMVEKEDYQTLMDLYNRDGFHESYYQMRNGRSMMALRNEKSENAGNKKIRNEELFSRIHQEYVEEEKKEEIEGSLSLFSDCPAILNIDYKNFHIVVEGDVVQTASRHPMEEEKVRKQMMKTGDTEFVFSHIEIYMGENVFIPIGQLNELRRKALEELKKEILYHSYRDNKKVEVSQKNQKKNIPANKFEISASVCTQDQLQAVMEIDEVRTIYADCGIFPTNNFYQKVYETILKMQTQGKKLFLMLPHIVRDKELKGREEYFSELSVHGLAGFLVRNMESFGILKKYQLEHQTVLDTNVYTMNGWTQRFWKDQGILYDTIPLELNQKELAHRDNKESELIIYGYAPMMVSVQCVQKNLDVCNHNFEKIILKDRYQKEFPVVCNCEFCYNTIYNTLPLSLLKESSKIKELGISKVRLAFTMEDKKTTKAIARTFSCVYGQGIQAVEEPSLKETTKGHFGRGVE